MEPLKIATILGDGIGPDIVNATMKVMTFAATQRGLTVEFDLLPAGLSALESHNSTFPDETRGQLPLYSGWLLGPVSHHIYPRDDTRFVNPSGYLRKQYSLYANVRPMKSFPNVGALRPDMDLVIVRENTEGFYADRNVIDGNGELRPNEDMVMSVRVVTRQACMAVAEHAFALARQRGRLHKVAAVHKANVLRLGDGLFLECCREVARSYPDIILEDFHVDAFAMMLVMRPHTFDVIVTTNMFGDILSDEAAGLGGGLGLAPGLNVGRDHALAQAVHGSAPDIEDLHQANPVAEILSGALLLRWLATKHDIPSAERVAGDIENAVLRVLQQGTLLTPDLGGSATTHEFTELLLRSLEGRAGDT